MKIACVTPILKSGEEYLLTNYRPISVLQCSSKILERIMYNRVYNVLTENKILYEKQLGFQSSHSTDHAVLQLSTRIFTSFNEKQFTLGVFIDFSKAFGTVDHKTLIKKLEKCETKHRYIDWFKSYLNFQKQYVCYSGGTTLSEEIKCGVPQGSILGSLLYLISVNDLQHVAKLLNQIMFADDTNLYYSNSKINGLQKQKASNRIRITELKFLA